MLIATIDHNYGNMFSNVHGKQVTRTKNTCEGIYYFIFTNRALRGHSNIICKVLKIYPAHAILQTHPDSAMSSVNAAMYLSSASISLSLAGAWIILIPRCCDHSGKPQLTLFPLNIIQWDLIL